MHLVNIKHWRIETIPYPIKIPQRNWMTLFCPFLSGQVNVCTAKFVNLTIIDEVHLILTDGLDFREISFKYFLCFIQVENKYIT